MGIQTEAAGIMPRSASHFAPFAKAMGHPTRIAILKFLASRNECFFGDIHEVLPISKATVSQHLSQLKNAGLIQGEIFSPKVKYCINPEKWEIAQVLFNELFYSYKDFHH